jgi:NADH-quinone oxidoreductase subunit N
MMLVAGAGDLISIFLGIEVLSVALYVLCALEIWRERSLESGLKYLITGAVGASILLYGLSLLFGATGSTSLDTIGATLQGTSFTDEPLVIAAMALIVGGLAFRRRRCRSTCGRPTSTRARRPPSRRSCPRR